jgi:Transglutaminase-like superfamily
MSRLVMPSVPMTMLRLALLKLALGLCGFGRTRRWLDSSVANATQTDPPDPQLLSRVEYAVAMSAALYPGHAACLERSLVLYWWLRRAGVPVRFRMGAQLYPFLAHAWVEYRGRVINDVPEHVKLFRPIEGGAA